MDVLLINKIDVLGRAIIPFQNLNMVGLYLSGLFNDSLIAAGDAFCKETTPLPIREDVVVKLLKLSSQVRNQCGFIMNLQKFIPLRL